MDPELKAMLAEHVKWPRHLMGMEKIRFLAFALAGEAGEMTGPLKKEWRGDDMPVGWMDELDKELADIANYTFMLAEYLGLDLMAEMKKKLHEVESRPAWINRDKGE